MFLLVPAYPGCPGSKAVKRSLLFCAGAVRQTVYRRRPGLPSRRRTTATSLNCLQDNVISARSLSTFCQRLKTFLFPASFLDIIADNSPTYSPALLDAEVILFLGPLMIK